MVTKLSKSEKEQIKDKLIIMKQEIMGETLSLVETLKSDSHDDYSDPFDRAKSESEHTINLRIEERKQKLTSKIEEAITRLENDEINLCKDCEEPIGFKRLLARPVTDMCIDCKQKEEQQERNKKI